MCCAVTPLEAAEVLQSVMETDGHGRAAVPAAHADPGPAAATRHRHRHSGA